MVEKKEAEQATALNVVILPNPSVTTEAIALSQKVAEKIDVHFTLNESSFRPHVTIYQGYYPNRNLPNLFEKLDTFIQDTTSIPVQMGSFDVSFETFVFWNIRKTKDLQDFHEQIVEIGNPYREGLIAPNVEDMLPNLNDEEKAVALSTGSILNKHLFLPHITITRIKDASDRKKVREILGDKNDAVFKPPRIAITKLGDHGTVSEIVKEFKFEI